MMRIFLIIVLFVIYSCSQGQSDSYFKISGITIDTMRKVGASDCIITLISDSGLVIDTKADSTGFYTFDSLKRNSHNYIIQATSKYCFSTKTKFHFNVIPNDTIINFSLVAIPASVDRFPVIYFISNSTIPTDSFSLAISIMTNFLNQDTDLKVDIMGFKDSSETIDSRQARANFVADAFIKNGIDKERIETSISDKPNVLWQDIMYPNPKTGKLDFVLLTEDYIKNFDLYKQLLLRQQNQCVLFKVMMK